MVSARTLGPSSVWSVLTSLEVACLLFAFSGVYKTLPGLAAIPVDLTVASGAWFAVRSAFELGTLRVQWEPGTLVAFAAVLLWLTFTAVSMTWSPGAEVAMIRLTRGLTLVGLAFALTCLFAAQSLVSLERILRLIPLFAGAAVIGTLQVLLDPLQSLSDAVTSSYIDRGIAMSMGAMVLLGCAITSTKSGAVRLAMALGAGLLGVMIVAAGSRQALAAFLLGLAFAGVIAISRGQAKAAIIGGVAAVAVVVSVSFLLAGAGLNLETLRRITVTVQSSGGGGSLGARVSHITNVVTHFEDAPWMGHGLGSFGYLFGDFAGDYPHNLFLEVAFEGGVVGLLLLALALVTVIFQLRRVLRIANDRTRVLLMLCLCVVAMNILVSTSFTSNRLFFTFLGLCCAGTLAAHSRGPRSASLVRALPASP